MDLRYLGFDQETDTRSYKFEGIEKGHASVQFVVTARLALFREHGIAIQDGPSLCAQKLTVDSITPDVSTHELTTEDFRAAADARSSADARKAEARRGGARKRAEA